VSLHLSRIERVPANGDADKRVLPQVEVVSRVVLKKEVA